MSTPVLVVYLRRNLPTYERIPLFHFLVGLQRWAASQSVSREEGVLVGNKMFVFFSVFQESREAEEQGKPVAKADVHSEHDIDAVLRHFVIATVSMETHKCIIMSCIQKTERNDELQ